MKTNYLSVLQLELMGFEIPVDAHVYQLIPNSGYRACGYPSHKKHSNEFIISISGSVTDMNLHKSDAFIKVEIGIIGRNFRPSTISSTWGYEVTKDQNDTRIIVTGTRDEQLALKIAKEKFKKEITDVNGCVAHTWNSYSHVDENACTVCMKDVG